MQRFASLLVLVALATACSSDQPDASPAASARSTSSSTAPRCTPVDDAVNEDDAPAARALLTASQLPPGDWLRTATTTCSWSRSSQDLLAVEECAALTGDVEGATQPRTGNAKATWVARDVELDGALALQHRIEFYLSDRQPAAVGSLLASPKVADCFTAALRDQVTDDPRARVGTIAVARDDPGLTAADLAAAADFVRGVRITTTVERDGDDEPVAIRATYVGAGGTMTTVSVTGTGAAAGQVEGVDMASLVRAAMQDLEAAL